MVSVLTVRNEIEYAMGKMNRRASESGKCCLFVRDVRDKNPHLGMKVVSIGSSPPDMHVLVTNLNAVDHDRFQG